MMLGRLEAEERLALIEGLLAAGGRTLSDADQRALITRLERTAQGNQRPKAPKFTADFLRRAGMDLTPSQAKRGLLGPDGEPITSDGKEVKTT
jgi:hypothetical protein